MIAGDVDEKTARWQMAQMVTESGIAEKVAARYINNMSWRRQETVDLASDLNDLLLDKAAGPAATLDLAILAGGAPLLGWAQRLAQAACAGVHNKYRRNAGRETPVDYSDVPKLAPVEETVVEEGLDLVASDWAVMSHNLRHAGRIHLAASIACSLTQLPKPARLIDRPDRDALLADIEADDSLARATLTSAAAHPLSAAWADWTDAQKAELAEQNVLYAHSLALAALTPIPQYQQGDLERLTREVVPLVGQLTRARKLVRLWGAMSAEMVCSEYGNADAVLKPLKQRACEKAAWQSYVGELVAGGFTAFGVTASQVSDEMEARLELLKRSAARAA